MNKKAGITKIVVFIIFVLAIMFIWKLGLLGEFWDFIKCIGKNKLECLN